MERSARPLVLKTAVALIAVVAVMLALWAHETSEAPAGETPYKAAGPRQGVDSSAARQATPSAGDRPATMGDAATAAPHPPIEARVRAILAASGPARWTEALRLLANADFGTWWSALSSAGLSRDPMALRWLADLRSLCILELRYRQTGDANQLNPEARLGEIGESLNDACAPLLVSVPLDRLDELGEEFNRQELAMELWVSPFALDRSDQSETERARQTELAIDAVESRSDPRVAQAALRELAQSRPETLLDDYEEFQRLSSRQRSLIAASASYLFACRMTNNCGPQSYWNLYFCSQSHPGIVCARGDGLEASVLRNLSAVELSYVRRILARAEQGPRRRAR